MTINRIENNGQIILQVEGNIDTLTAPELENQILDVFKKNSELIIDMGKVSYISSAGLRALLVAEKTAKNKQGHFTLVNVQEQVMMLFRACNFDKILTIR